MKTFAVLLYLLRQTWSDFKQHFLLMCILATFFVLSNEILQTSWSFIVAGVDAYYGYLMIRMLKALYASFVYVVILQALVCIVYHIRSVWDISLRSFIGACIFDAVCYVFQNYTAIHTPCTLIDFFKAYYLLLSIIFLHHAIMSIVMLMVISGIFALMHSALSYRLWFVDIYLLAHQGSFCNAVQLSWNTAVGNFMIYFACCTLAYSVKHFYGIGYRFLPVFTHTSVYVFHFFYFLIHIFFFLLLVHASKKLQTQRTIT